MLVKMLKYDAEIIPGHFEILAIVFLRYIAQTLYRIWQDRVSYVWLFERKKTKYNAECLVSTRSSSQLPNLGGKNFVVVLTTVSAFSRKNCSNLLQSTRKKG